MYCTKWGIDIPEAGLFCQTCGYGIAAPPESTVEAATPDAAKVTVETYRDASSGRVPSRRKGPAISAKRGGASAPVRLTEGRGKSSLNFGTVVLTIFSVVSLEVFLANRLVPIYALGSVLSGALAWYFYKMCPRGRTTNLALLSVVLAVTAGEAYSVGRRWGADSYTYVQRADHQYRVDSGSGRTDVLRAAGGWEPVSFGRRSEPLPSVKVLDIFLSDGQWETAARASGPGEICFDVDNHSDYVLEDVGIGVSVEAVAAGDTSSGRLPAAVSIKRESGGLLDKGKQDRFCGTAPWAPPSGTRWSYTVDSATGWKE